jgi:hypothetical protein
MNAGAADKLEIHTWARSFRKADAFDHAQVQ